MAEERVCEQCGTGFVPRREGDGFCVWLHAVSVGEVNVCTQLIRALEPVEGIDLMRRRRSRRAKGRTARRASALASHLLCSGPGNLTMAMGITLAENRADLLGDRLWIEDRDIDVDAIVWGPRIGINVGTERPWRASIAGHRAVSGPPRP
jgi:DNA-3-methyladenine glycosylase